MNIKQLLEKLSRILHEDRQAQLGKYKSLKKVLKALREEKTILEESLPNSEDEELKHKMESRLKIISAQRKKGLKVLKDLKKEKRAKTNS